MTTTSPVPPDTADWVDPAAMLHDPYETYDRLRTWARWCGSRR